MKVESDIKNSLGFEELTHSIFAKNLIVSLSPPALKQVKLSLKSPLVDKLRGSLNCMEVGDVTKTFVTYDKPFWRKKNLSGSVSCMDSAIISEVLDFSCDRTGNGTFLLFSVGPKSQRVAAMKPDDFKKEIINSLVKYFGNEAYNYFDYFSHSYKLDEFVQGGYNSLRVISDPDVPNLSDIV